MSELVVDPSDSAHDEQSPRQRRWPDYVMVWRWHFYAGVYYIPFVLILSVTGTIFLFRPQIESWEERDLDRLTSDRSAISYADQVRAVQLQTTGWLASMEVTSEPTTQPGYASATRVIVQTDGQRLRAYIDPFTGEVLRVVNKSERFIRFIRQIHGELLLGKRGSYLVLSSAVWCISSHRGDCGQFSDTILTEGCLLARSHLPFQAQRTLKMKRLGAVALSDGSFELVNVARAAPIIIETPGLSAGMQDVDQTIRKSGRTEDVERFRGTVAGKCDSLSQVFSG